MANCQKNTDYQILNSSGQQVRNIALSADGKTLEITLINPPDGVECTFSIDSANFTGIKLIGENLQIVDAISGLNNQISKDASKASARIVKNAAGKLEIIGIDDQVMSLEANIRYDSANDEVIMEY